MTHIYLKPQIGLKLKILILGSTGLLGTSLAQLLQSDDIHVETLTKNGPSTFCTDATIESNLFRVLKGHSFDVIINLIALTSVEQCEDHPNLAHRINTIVVENIAKWISLECPGAHLIHVSSDHVYDGIGPHKEEDTTLVNTYALTKYAAELATQIVSSTVIRTNFIGPSLVRGRESMTDWLFTSLVRREHIQVLDDVLFSPLTIKTLCELMRRVILDRPKGIYNLGSSLGMSKADFDFKFAKALNLDTKFMTRIESSSAKFLRARRPLDMRMDSGKFENLFGVKLPTLDEELLVAVEDYKKAGLV